MQERDPSDPQDTGEQPAPAETTSRTVDTSASAGSRIGAGAIDAFILTLVWLFLSGASGGVAATDASVNFNLTGWWFLLFLVLFFGYHFGLELAFGKTFGKHLLDLRVVDTSGRPAAPRAVLIRNLLRFVDVLPFYYLVGIVAIAASKQRQRLGDVAADTIVVQKSTSGRIPY